MRFLEFEDFDAYVSAVRHADVHMMCDHLDERQWQLANWDFAGISLQWSREGGGNLCEGVNSLSGPTLFLPMTRPEVNSANGQLLDRQSLVVVDPGGEFCITARRRAHEWASILLPSATEGTALPGVPPAVFACRVVRPEHGHLGRLADLVRRIGSATPSPDCLPEPALRAASTELLETALACIGTVEPPTAPEVGRPRLQRHEIVRRSLEFIEDHATGPISVATLADAAFVSERTLRAAFHDYYGLSPVQYMQVRLLYRVRKALRRASAENTTVTEILAAHGIWEFGRFACRYRAHFGEAPSETLRRRPG